MTSFNFFIILQAALLYLLFGNVQLVEAGKCRLTVRSRGGGNSPPSRVMTSTAPAPTASAGSNISSSPPTSSFTYGKDKIRGVNLGGWLVLEPWITPSIFEATNNDAIVDEFTLGSMLDPKWAQSLLQKHWDTWITEDDFIAIKAAGLTHVRIPLGYWSVPLAPSDTNTTTTTTSPYIPGAWPYLLKALQWAQTHNIRVIVDLHGAPGSQNGFDNSGQRTDNPQWAAQAANVQRTLDTLRFIVTNLGDQIDVIELLNEAAGFRSAEFAQVVRQFWADGYAVVREAVGMGIKVMIGDAFLGVQSWSGFLTAPGAEGVMMDYHEYQIFSDPELSRSFDDHLSFACSWIPTLSSFEQSNIWTVVGEWSTAPTDCAKWLNGRGVGARWDATWFPGPNSQFHGKCDNFTGSYKGFSEDYKVFLRKYWEAQVDIGESIQGWVYWTWKAENADEWSYQKGLEGGWIPRDPTERKYPDICSSSRA